MSVYLAASDKFCHGLDILEIENTKYQVSFPIQDYEFPQ